MLIQPPSSSGSLISRFRVAPLRRAAARLLLLTPLAVLSIAAPHARAQVTATETILNSFNGIYAQQGGNAPLIQGKDGNFYGTLPLGGPNEAGTVYQLTPAGAFNILYNFSTGTGNTPYGPLLVGKDGNFYGTAYSGGSGNGGSVFKLTPDGALSTLYSFVFGAGDGDSPRANLVQGSDGNFYGTTTFNGTNPNGTVFQLTPTGVLKTLYSFPTGTSVYPGALIQGSDGNLYGTTQQGGAHSAGFLYQVTLAGAFKVIYDFGGSDGQANPSVPVQDSDGNFYGTTSGNNYSLGQTGGGTVYKITPAGALTILHTFTGGSDGSGPNPLVLGGDGSLYGTTGQGGAKNDGIVFRITRAGVYTILYSFLGQSGPNDDDGAGPAAALLLGSDGNLYGTTGAGGNTNQGAAFKVTVNTPPAFFDGQILLPDGVDYLSFPDGNYFGYYSFLADPNYLYHFDLGYEYVSDANDGKSGVYLYDFASNTFFYTSPSFPFPYLYDFTLNTVLYYYPDPSNPGHYNTNGYRFFYDFATGQVITK